MIDELKDIIKGDKFKVLLNNPDIWESLDVDYHPPHVERVWMRINDKRISLHVIHPCHEHEALVHPHPWKSAMYVLPIGGRYEHRLGVRGEGDAQFDLMISKQEFRGDAYYEMTQPCAIHSVRPIGMPVYTIMLSGPVIWPENKTEVGKELKPLSDERKEEILLMFKSYFE